MCIRDSININIKIKITNGKAATKIMAQPYYILSRLIDKNARRKAMNIAEALRYHL